MQEILVDIEQMIRKSISEEQEAISMYLDRKSRCLNLINNVNNDIKEKLHDFIYTLDDIMDEERTHIGQLREMLQLFNISDKKEKEGEKEAKRDIISDSFISIAHRLQAYLMEEK